MTDLFQNVHDHPWIEQGDKAHTPFGVRAASCGLATVNGKLHVPGWPGAMPDFPLDLGFSIDEDRLWMTHLSERWRFSRDYERIKRIAGPFRISLDGRKTQMECLSCKWHNRFRVYANNRYNIADATTHRCGGRNQPVLFLGTWAMPPVREM